MATWQQGINSGGLLAGIGGMNANAPRSSDADTALAYIRQNNDIERSGANNIGLQALTGLGATYAGIKQYDQQQAAKEFNQAHANAWATGDTSGLVDFAQKNPQFVAQAQQAVAGLNQEQKTDLGNLAMQANTALAQGPEAYSKFVNTNSDRLQRVGADPAWMLQAGISNPEQLSHLTTTMAMGALGPEKMFDVLDKKTGRTLEQGRLNESIRSNKASEANTIRGQNITMRGQDISAQNSLRSAGGAVPSSVREFQYFNSLSPEQQQTYLRVRGRPGGDANNTVQLADGRTVTVAGKLHGSGANAFYEGRDDNGNMVRVPASSISAPPTSAASAQNYAMKKDIDAIANADAGNLDFMTGVTGGAGNPAIGADVRSRIGGKEQRQLYNAARRVQGRMQNQGVAAARDMGASGINTVAEAKMYFQGMPQVDYSSPEAMQQSIRDISEYTNNYNQQYQVNVGGRNSTTKPTPAAPANSGYQSLWGD